MNSETSKTLKNIIHIKKIPNFSNISGTDYVERNLLRKNKTSKIIGNVELNNISNNPKNRKYSNNISGECSITEPKNNQINLKIYNDSKVNNLTNYRKFYSSKQKISLIKKPLLNNFNLRKNARDQLFKTEIEQKIYKSKDDNKKSDFSTTYTDHFNQQKNINTLKNNLNPQNPLLIPKEDMIFEEIKNYKCFKYFTKKSLAKTSVPFIYINMNMNTTKKIPPKKKVNNNPYQINFNNDIKKFIEFDELFLNKNKQIYFSEEKKKNILDNVYKPSPDEDMYEKINLIKLKKLHKKLKNYQYEFLKVVKHNINDKYYEDLKDKFNEIRILAEGKYKTNFKFIKDVEKDEEKVIKGINKAFESFIKYARRKSIRGMLKKPGTPNIALPLIKFKKIIDDDIALLLKNKIDNNKQNIYASFSESKRMTKKNINRINMDNISNFNSNKNINFMMTTSSKFNKFKNLQDKI